MPRSMTGFARARASNEAYEVVVEVRSVNHRYLDVRTRGAPGLGAIEKQIRDRVSGRVARGKVDVSLHLRPKAESAYELEIDRPLIRELVESAKVLAAEMGVRSDIGLGELIGFSPAFQVKERDLSEGASLWQALEPALEQALEELDRMRAAEGAETRADLEARVQTLGRHVDRIEVLSEKTREIRRKNLQARVEELLGSGVDAAAVAMEVSRLVERSDISEEITRFRSHIELWNDTLSRSDPCGKKLDFIVQEMNREVNTMGSKSQDAEIAEGVIAMKAELERVREQVQNIE